MLLFMDGFDHYTAVSSAKKKWDDGSKYRTDQALPGRFGGRCVQPEGSRNLFHLTWPGMTKTINPAGVSTLIFGAAMKFDELLTEGVPFCAVRGNDYKHQIQLFLSPTTGEILVGLASGAYPIGISTSAPPAPVWYDTGGPTPTGATGFVPPVGLWFYLEVKVSASGELDIYADGDSIFSDTGIDTLVGSATGYVGPCFMGLGQSALSLRIDDVYICDGSGTVNNDVLGEIRVEYREPDGDGDTTDFVPSVGGTNGPNVNGITNYAETGDPAQYNRSDVLNAIDLYTMANFDRDGTIFGVQVSIGCRKDDVGNRKIRPIIKPSGGSIAEGPESKVYSDYTHVGYLWEENPQTTDPWTKIEVDSLQTGIKIST